MIRNFIIIFSSLICRQHDERNQTCPILVPNHVLYYWISNWCEANGVEQPKRLESFWLYKETWDGSYELIDLDTLMWKPTLVISYIEEYILLLLLRSIYFRICVYLFYFNLY